MTTHHHHQELFVLCRRCRGHHWPLLLFGVLLWRGLPLHLPMSKHYWRYPSLFQWLLTGLGRILSSYCRFFRCHHFAIVPLQPTILLRQLHSLHLLCHSTDHRPRLNPSGECARPNILRYLEQTCCGFQLPLLPSIRRSACKRRQWMLCHENCHLPLLLLSG